MWLSCSRRRNMMAHLKSEFNYKWEIAMRSENTTPEWREKQKQKTAASCFSGISIRDKLKQMTLVSNRSELNAVLLYDIAF
ncbi:hypothetical protein OS493_026970 [Desmophyllum pertusum]|uniref:Uncharacterized protein n=1 Tax=Desmophyllum pertusum TaxID=174260 RepID=A0A9X0CRZ2_9CNID|nr:hypothetical protein OS493_026970 [Desmophyllum pertusum]